MICTLTGCDLVMAREAFDQTGDVTLAVDKILFKTELPPKKKRVMDEANVEISKIRETMKQLDKKMDERPDSTVNQFSTSLNQLAHGESIVIQDLHEETVLQNNCSQECQLPVLQSEAQTQGTAYPLQFESIYDLLLSGQT